MATPERLPVAHDIIIQAINAYDGYMADDDFNSQACLKRIIGTMKERAELHGIISTKGSGGSSEGGL